MTSAPVFAVPAPHQPAVSIRGTAELFPVRRIYCVGRNYLAHIREMQGNERELPFFFQKPADAIVLSGGEIPYPPQTQDFHHEIELVLAIGKAGANIPAERAADFVFGTAIGIDLTRRDLQLIAKNSGRPWESGKSFDCSAPIGEICALNQGMLPEAGAISLSVNGQVRQFADLGEMIWNCAEIISQLSSLYELKPGDLVYTGTPAGVSPLKVGDRLLGEIAGLGRLEVTIV